MPSPASCSALGCACNTGAQKTTQAGIVTAIIATTPLFLLPMTRLIEHEKIGVRPLIGALIAVAGVIGLTFSANSKRSGPRRVICSDSCHVFAPVLCIRTGGITEIETDLEKR